MKKLFCIMALIGIINRSQAEQSNAPILPVAIDVTKRVPLDFANLDAFRTYANDYSYYFQPRLKDGMRVLFSASYGVGGEAGQAAGTVVEKDGRFWFKQRKNPTTQLMLPPGLTFHSNSNLSMWDLGAYMNLINRVVFSEPNAASKTANNIYGANKPKSYLVDFKGGTAGDTVLYEDAMEVEFEMEVGNRSKSNFKVYYAKNIGPVALEFREKMSPSGTYKFYLGE